MCVNKRIGDLEFLVGSADRSPEIIRHITTSLGDSRYTLLWFIRGSEGFSVQFIGDRPFGVEIDRFTLWKLMRYGQRVCDAIFEVDERT